MINSSVFFSGIGGSGMLPLACIVRASGAKVAGSDRSLDAGRTPQKFDYLRSLGIQLFPQDGSGLHDGMTLGHLGGGRGQCSRRGAGQGARSRALTRPQFLARLLNDAQRSVAVGGTSGKSTVTGMIGWILHACHRQPTVMNGAVMKNFVTPSAPFASALVGDPELFVSEVDESDGSIALYQPEIAVLTNISLDHKELAELRELFAHFLNRSRKAVLNLDDPETRALSEARAARQGDRLRLRQPRRGLHGQGPAARSRDGVTFAVEAEGERHDVRLAVPGRHNASNALAAIAATRALGIRVEDAVNALGALRRTEAAAGDGRRGGWRHRHRRLRAQPRQDRRDLGDASRTARAAADHVPAARLRTAAPRWASSWRTASPREWRRTTGSICPIRSTRAAPSSELAVPTGSHEQVGERERQAEHIAERTRIGDALVAEAKSGDRILDDGRARRHVDRLRTRASGEARPAELIAQCRVSSA